MIDIKIIYSVVWVYLIIWIPDYVLYRNLSKIIISLVIRNNDAY